MSSDATRVPPPSPYALARATPQTASPNGRAGNRVASPDTIPPPSPYAQALAEYEAMRAAEGCGA